MTTLITRFKETVLFSFRGLLVKTAALEVSGIVLCSLGNVTQPGFRLSASESGEKSLR